MPPQDLNLFRRAIRPEKISLLPIKRNFHTKNPPHLRRILKLCILITALLSFQPID